MPDPIAATERDKLLSRLAAGPGSWNDWIAKQASIVIDLSGVDFSSITLPSWFERLTFPHRVIFDGAHFPSKLVSTARDS